MAYAEPAAPRRVLPIALVAGGAAFLRRRAPARGQGDARGRGRVPARGRDRRRRLGEAGLHVAEHDRRARARDLVRADQALRAADRAAVQPRAVPALPARARLRLGDPDRAAPRAAGGGRPGRRDPAADRRRGRLDDRQLRQPERDGRTSRRSTRCSTSSASCSCSRSSPRRSTGCRTSSRSCGCSSSGGDRGRAVRDLRGAHAVQLLRPPRRVRADPRPAGARGARRCAGAGCACTPRRSTRSPSASR